MVSEVQFGWQSRLQSGLEACSRHDYNQAKEHFLKALELAHQESAPDHAVGEIFFNIAWCHQALGEYQGAEQRYKQSLATVERCYGVGSEAQVKVLQQLSGLYRSANRSEEADAYAMRAHSSQAGVRDQIPQADPRSESEPQTASQAQRPHSAAQSSAHQSQSSPHQPQSTAHQPQVSAPSGIEAPKQDSGSTEVESSSRPQDNAIPVVKPARAGIVMDGVPVATKQSGFVAGSMFKAKAEAASSANERPAENQYSIGVSRQSEEKKSPAPNAYSLEPADESSVEPGSTNPSSTKPAYQPPSVQQSSVQLSNEVPQAPAQSRRKLPRSLATAAGAEQDMDYDEIVSDSGESQGPFVIEDLVHPKEKIYRRLSGAVGCWVYFLSVIYWGVGLVVAPLALLFFFIKEGIYLGQLRGSGIRVSNRQFPEVQAHLEKYCTVLKMEVPEVLVVNHDGLLNAFAHRLHRKNMIVICSDVLELAYEQGEKELAFVVVHELAHLKLGHLKWHWLYLPGNLVPFLGSAYSRACEYSCDRIARHLVPDGALFGLVSLAAGTKLYRQVNLSALYEQAEQDWDFWTWFAEIQSTHPNLVNRIRAIGIKDAEVKKRVRNIG